jgi:hypothetical protein
MAESRVAGVSLYSWPGTTAGQWAELKRFAR